jgi:hypothetical protein
MEMPNNELMKNKIQLANSAIEIFVALSKSIDGESTRFIGLFKHDKKKAYNQLLIDLQTFLETVTKNVCPENIEQCEILEDYIYKMIVDEIEIQKRKDIDIFCSLNKMLKMIYEKYIDGINHNNKQEFVNLYKSSNFFANIVGVNKEINDDFEYFCNTLITGNEFKREIV